jgi:hypothetical protein
MKKLQRINFLASLYITNVVLSTLIVAGKCQNGKWMDAIQSATLLNCWELLIGIHYQSVKMCITGTISIQVGQTVGSQRYAKQS